MQHKKKKNGKLKGNNFELIVSHLLTDWTGKKHEFNRTPGSGGSQWKEDNNVTGDIVPPFKLCFPVSIECKKQEIDWQFDRFLTFTSEIYDWWEQCKRDAIKYNRIPWLIFSKNYRSIYIMLKGSDLLKYKAITSGLVDEIPCFCLVYNSEELVVLDFKKWLDSITLEEVLKVKNNKL
jgi:hypothetical protein